MVVVIVIFAGCFGAAALLLLAIMAPGSKEAKQTRSRLEQLRGPQSNYSAEESLDLRRVEQFSSLPWLNAILQKVDVTERVRLLLQQADLKWTVGRLLVVSAALAAVAG